MKNSIPLLLLFLWSFTCNAQITVPLQESLEKIISQNAILHGIYGMSVAIIMPDGSTWTSTYGINGAGEPITDSTLFYAGNSTEMYVATLLLQLEEEGLINVNHKVTKYISPITDVDTNITIQQLLNHISGLPNIFLNSKLDKDLANVSPAHVYAPGEALKLWLEKPSKHIPGTVFYFYNPTDYIIPALIIEAVTHNTIQDELRKRFWKPLNMRHTYWAGFDLYHLPTAGGWSFKKDKKVIDFSKYRETIPFLTASWGNGNLVTTPRDACRFVRALATTTLLGATTFTKMQTVVIRKNTAGYDFGFGLERLKMGRTYAYGSAGGIYYFLGNGMLVFHHPAEEITISVASNTCRMFSDTRQGLLFKTHEEIFLCLKDFKLRLQEITFSKNDK